MIHSASSEFYSQHQKQYHQQQHRSNYLNGGGGGDRWCRPTLIDPPPRDEAFQQTLEQLRLNSRDTLSPAQLEQLQLKAMPPMMMKKKNGGKKIAKKDKDNKDSDDGDDHDDGRDPEVNEGDEGDDEENAHPANHQLRAPAHRETHPLAQHKIETIKNHYHLMLLERHLAQPPTSETEEVAKEEAEGGVAQASSAKRSGSAMTGGSEKDPDEEHQADINGHHNGKGSANGMASITPGKATTSGSSSRQNGSSSSNGGHSTRHSIGHSISNLFSKWTHSKSHNDAKKSLPAVVKLAEPQSPTHQLDESTLIVFGQKGEGAGAENLGEKKAQFSKLKKNSKFFKHAPGQDLEGAEEGAEEEENIEADEEEAKSAEKQGRLSKLKRSKTIAALKFFNFKSKRRSAPPNQTSSSSSSSASFSFPSSSSHPRHLPESESSTSSLAANHHHPHPPHPSSKSFIKSHLHLSNAKKASKQDESVDDDDDQSGSHFINSKVHSINRAKSSSFNLLSSRPPIYQQQQQQQKSLIVAPVTSVNYSSKATTFAFDKEHRAEELNTEVFASGKHKQQHFQHIPSKNLLKPPPASSSSAEHHRSKPSTSKTEGGGGGGGSLTSLLFGARLRKSQSVHESSTSTSSVTPVHKAVENSSNTSSSSSSNHHHHQTTTSTSFFKSFARSKQQRRKNASSSDVATVATAGDQSSPPLIGKHQRHHRSMVGLRRIHSNTGANSAGIISSLASTSGGSSSGVKSVIRRRQSQNQLNSSRTPIDQANQAKDRISKRLSLPADLNLPFNFVNRILTEKEMEEELARAKREGKIGIIGRDYIRPSMRGFARQVAAARRGGNSGNGNAGTSGNDSEFTDEDFADLATSPTLFAESPEIIGLFSPLLSDDNTPLSRRIRRQSLVSET